MNLMNLMINDLKIYFHFISFLFEDKLFLERSLNVLSRNAQRLEGWCLLRVSSVKQPPGPQWPLGDHLEIISKEKRRKLMKKEDF